MTNPPPRSLPSLTRTLAIAGVLLSSVMVLQGCIYVRTREVRVVDAKDAPARKMHEHHEFHTDAHGEDEPPMLVMQSPAEVNHVVFMKLKDPSDRRDLLEDCREMTRQIPGITSVFCGSHLDIGRGTVETDYDLCLYVGFIDTHAYEHYVDHPAHVGLVTEWKPKLEWLRVYDIRDEG
ncbi:MAG: Dabb family protein [Phycisphaeraceae bacterium]|nr:Dabb family protein [Phycisphaerales bacterium]MCB9859912.1 Dabb family protein [Phycisphaeraceae bacterium]